MALELGMDLFIFGGDVFHRFVKHLMSVSYDLLGRETFAKILQVSYWFGEWHMYIMISFFQTHLKNRSHPYFTCKNKSN